MKRFSAHVGFSLLCLGLFAIFAALIYRDLTEPARADAQAVTVGLDRWDIMRRYETATGEAVTVYRCDVLPSVDLREYDEEHPSSFVARDVLDAVGSSLGGCTPVDNGDGSFSWRYD